MGTTPISGFPYPVDTDAFLVHTAIQNLAKAIEEKAFMTFTSASDRTTKVPVPVVAMVSFRTDAGVFEYYNGSAWAPYVDYTSLGRTKSVKPTAYALTISTTSFTSYTGASITFPKLFAASNLRIHVEHSAYIGATDLTGTQLYAAVSFNGTDYAVNASYKFDVVSAHESFLGTVDLGAGVAAGNYTLQLKYKLVSATGGRVIKFDTNDQLFMSVEEIQAL